jgi:hypothetical protein
MHGCGGCGGCGGQNIWRTNNGEMCGKPLNAQRHAVGQGTNPGMSESKSTKGL